MTTVSVVGCGNIGEALVTGLVQTGDYTVTKIDLNSDAVAAIADDADWTTDDVARPERPTLLYRR